MVCEKIIVLWDNWDGTIVGKFGGKNFQAISATQHELFPFYVTEV